MSTTASIFPAPYVILPCAEHRYTLVMLHGRGSNGKEFAEEFFEGRTSAEKPILEHLSPYCKWIFPSAHERYSTVFQEEMQEWFDIYSLTEPDAEYGRQIDGLVESVNYIRDIVEQEMKILPANRIILGGISQGFAISAHVLFSLSTSIGGFFGLSGWIPLKALAVTQPIESKDTPVYISHSKDDTTVKSGHGMAACARMNHLCYKARFQVYEDGEHWIQEPRGYDDLSDFLERCLQ